MKKISETIIFFGSGPVAAKSLELLIQDFEIEAVITKPKPEHHRGDFPVVELAKKLGIKTFMPANKQELESLFTTKPAKSQIGVLIDYGIIVPQTVIDYFRLGIVNSHFSLLPEWRGADPITFSILSGQTRTGVSLMLLVAAMDEGPLLAQASFEISSTMTTPQLTDQLIELSHQSLAAILPLYVKGETQPAPQESVSISGSRVPTYSRKLTKQDGVIAWQKPAAQLEREIRAFIDWPKSTTTLAGKPVIITKAHVIQTQGEAGKVIVENGNLAVFCGRDTLVIDALKPAGKKEMTGRSFLAGYGNKL